MYGEPTTVFAIRLTEYQREKLKILAQKKGIKEADFVRNLINREIASLTEQGTPHS